MRENRRTLDAERARDALKYLDPSCSREDWIRIGMAAKASGLSFDDFHIWSIDAGNYTGKNACLSAWNSFKADGGITSATLFLLAKQNGWQSQFNTNNNLNNTHNKPTKNTSKDQIKSSNLTAFEIWEKCQPANQDHGYIKQKNGIPDGLRIYPPEIPLLIKETNIAGYLAVPCWQNGKLQTIQFIPSCNGKKLNLPNNSFGQGYFAVGNLDKDTEVIFICEGLGQAWAANRTTKAVAVVCFGAMRMGAVTKALHVEYPNTRLIVVPDRGKERETSTIAEAVNGQWIELPNEKPLNYDINDFAEEYGDAALTTLLNQTKSPDLHFKMLSGIELVSSPPMTWLIQDIIPTEGLIAIYGASGSGKSFLTLDLAFAIASGESHWFGLRVRQAPVTYVCLEGEAGIGKRISAWHKYTNKAIPASLKFVTQPFNLLTDDVAKLANSIISSNHSNGLIIIDTLNRATPGTDENSSTDMGVIISAAQQLEILTKCTVCFVHHSGKDVTKGLRGHSSLFAALDGAIEVIKTSFNREWRIAKSKDEETGARNPFKLEVLRIGLNEYGDDITSCVALFDGTNTTPIKTISLGRNQKIAMEEINKLLETFQTTDQTRQLEEPACINYEQAILAIADKIPADRKYQKLRAKEAIASLVDKKLLGFKGDWIWKR